MTVGKDGEGGGTTALVRACTHLLDFRGCMITYILLAFTCASHPLSPILLIICTYTNGHARERSSL